MLAYSVQWVFVIRTILYISNIETNRLKEGTKTTNMYKIKEIQYTDQFRPSAGYDLCILEIIYKKRDEFLYLLWNEVAYKQRQNL